MKDTPRVGEIVHASPDDLLPGITNSQTIGCRAAIVSGEPALDGSFPAHIVPAWSTAYNATVRVWHRIEDCQR